MASKCLKSKNETSNLSLCQKKLHKWLYDTYVVYKYRPLDTDLSSDRSAELTIKLFAD